MAGQSPCLSLASCLGCERFSKASSFLAAALSSILKLEAKQEQQGDEIKALQFLVANVLTGDEAEYLRIFASSEAVRFGGDYDSVEAFSSGGALEHRSGWFGERRT